MLGRERERGVEVCLPARHRLLGQTVDEVEAQIVKARGAICVLGQLILDGYRSLGLDKTDAGTATSVTLIFLAALTTGLNLYNSLARFAGAGTLVPITGFANSVVSPAIDFKAEGIITGMAAKMFVIAGPVIVFGTLASVVYGVVLMLMG